jgi:hypothetical protein
MKVFCNCRDVRRYKGQSWLMLPDFDGQKLAVLVTVNRL